MAKVAEIQISLTYSNVKGTVRKIVIYLLFGELRGLQYIEKEAGGGGTGPRTVWKGFGPWGDKIAGGDKGGGYRTEGGGRQMKG